MEKHSSLFSIEEVSTKTKSRRGKGNSIGYRVRKDGVGFVKGKDNLILKDYEIEYWRNLCMI